jgi:hypothetical protein
MPSLFVFTAGNTEAQQHLQLSIKSSLPPETVLGNFDGSAHPHLLEIQNQAGGFYAWGATPGLQNEARGERMKEGDSVLCVYGNTYRYAARVVATFRNANCARAIWGTDADGRTWEYMYFLTKPVEVTRPVMDLAEELSERYLGFTRIGDEKVERLVRRYGSLDAFVDRQLVRREAAYLLLRSNVDSKWRDEEANSYHYGTNVPNYTKLVAGTEFLLDRRFPEGVRVIGRGTGREALQTHI